MEIDLKKRKYERKEGRLIPRKKYPSPFRYVGGGFIITLIILVVLFRIIVC
jgi:uncharacterized membrane protein YukC